MFKPYMEDPSYLKCWHNYGFDRHIFFNHGIDVRGFGGDTMHMARLADPSRMRYGLKPLTEELEGDIYIVKQGIISWMNDKLEEEIQLAETKEEKRLLKRRLEMLVHYKENYLKINKVDIQSTFGFYKKLASGGAGKILQMPDLELMHVAE